MPQDSYLSERIAFPGLKLLAQVDKISNTVYSAFYL